MDFGLREDFVDLISKARKVKTKINEWDYICTTKETTSKTKRLLTKWEMIFANSSKRG